MNEIFKKVTLEEREVIWQQACLEKAGVIFQLNQKTMIKSRIEGFYLKSYVACRRPKHYASLKTKSEASSVLTFANENYFFKSLFHIEGDSLLFRKNVDLFYLPRRKNKRLKIPDHLSAMLMIKKQNENLTFLRAEILDFSDSGCKIGLNTDKPSFHKGDLIIGNLKFGHKTGMEIHGELKHHFKNENGRFKQIFGLSFEQLSEAQTTQLRKLFVDLQAEIFYESAKK
ncbi:MAG: PilZ domain-containing protein [Bdellovibrionaceae bacterium]|nr:PilZ domain-containing protein [Pseudobdellovibrionaceae bacterium]NUM58550.1 PilZ domain-containing protein [Pseudobdellovibrionaceae bacterium]